jgi:hypothetical protein
VDTVPRFTYGAGFNVLVKEPGYGFFPSILGRTPLLQNDNTILTILVSEPESRIRWLSYLILPGPDRENREG